VVTAHIVYTGKCVCESSKIAVWFMVSNVAGRWVKWKS